MENRGVFPANAISWEISSESDDASSGHYPSGWRRSAWKTVGSGTFITSTRVQKKCEAQPVFTEIMKSQGKDLASQVILPCKNPIPNLKVDKLGIDRAETIIRVERVRYADGVPVVYEVASIQREILRISIIEEVTSHFFQTERHGYKIGENRTQTIYARLAKDIELGTIQISKGQAILGSDTGFPIWRWDGFWVCKGESYVGERFRILFRK